MFKVLSENNNATTLGELQNVIDDIRKNGATDETRIITDYDDPLSFSLNICDDEMHIRIVGL